MAKILLVEDDTNLSEIYQARMEAEGYEVVSASDGESALAIAAKEKPDLIISDVMMPKISGFEMLDILRNTDGLKQTPVIMLTALGQSDDKGRAEQLGADRYLVKSQVTLEDIVNAAHALLEGENPGTPAPAVAAPIDSVSGPSDAGTPPAANDIAGPVAAAPTGPLEATAPAEPLSAVPVVPAPADTPVIPVAAAPSADPSTDVAATDTTDATDTNAGTPVASEPSPVVSHPVGEDRPPDVPDTTPNPDDKAGTEDNANFPQGGSTVEVAASPAATAAPTATSAATQVIADETVAASSAARSLAQENDQLRRQIEGFEHRPVAPVRIPTPAQPATTAQPTITQPAAISTTTLTVDTPQPVSQPTAAPAPQQQPAPATPPAPLSAHAIDEKVVARAIEQLLVKSPQSATASPATQNPAPPQPEHGRVLQSADTIDSSSASNIDRPQKKVIAPIPHPPAPSLAELVAIEEAKEMADASNQQNFATMATVPQSNPAPAADAVLPQAVLPSAAASTSPSSADAPNQQTAEVSQTAGTSSPNLTSLQAAAAADPTQPSVVLPGVITPTAATNGLDGQPIVKQPAANKPAFDPNSIAL